MSTAKSEKSMPGNAVKTFVGLFVIWLSFYLVALAHEWSLRESNRQGAKSERISGAPGDTP